MYRFYDSDDVLLYIGIASNMIRRARQHERHSEWFHEAVTADIEHFASREEALEAEREAIIAERPMHNVVHSVHDGISDIPRPKSNSELGEWLESVNRARFTRETGFSQQVVYRAVQNGIFPAGWYAVIRTWCGTRDIPCPDHLFGWTATGKDEGDAQ